MAKTATKKIGRAGAGRKRRATGWTLLVLGLLVAGVWAASGWWAAEWQWGRSRFACDSGEVVLLRYSVDMPDSWSFYPHVAEMRGINWFTPSDPDGWNLGVLASKPRVIRGAPARFTYLALWPIPLLLFAAGVSILRSGILARRRAVTGSCAKCGYSLAGLAEGTGCPECGKGAGTK